MLKAVFVIATMHVLVPSDLTSNQLENIQFIQSMSGKIGADPYEMLAFSYVLGNLGNNKEGALYLVDCDTTSKNVINRFKSSCSHLQRDRISNFLFFSHSLVVLKKKCNIQDTRICMEHVLGKEESIRLYKIRQDFERLTFLRQRRSFNSNRIISPIKPIYTR